MAVLDSVKIVPVTALRRNFGSLTKGLSSYREIILTRDGKPFALLRPARELRRDFRERARGAWKGTSLDSDSLWNGALKKKSRARRISL
jgi:antitoxin (DNA-binding transcriptional repressor) of toxin-antitoxin stability system